MCGRSSNNHVAFVRAVHEVHGAVVCEAGAVVGKSVCGSSTGCCAIKRAGTIDGKGTGYGPGAAGAGGVPLQDAVNRDIDDAVGVDIDGDGMAGADDDIVVGSGNGATPDGSVVPAAGGNCCPDSCISVEDEEETRGEEYKSLLHSRAFGGKE